MLINKPQDKIVNRFNYKKYTDYPASLLALLVTYTLVFVLQDKFGKYLTIPYNKLDSYWFCGKKNSNNFTAAPKLRNYFFSHIIYPN